MHNSIAGPYYYFMPVCQALFSIRSTVPMLNNAIHSTMLQLLLGQSCYIMWTDSPFPPVTTKTTIHFEFLLGMRKEERRRQKENNNSSYHQLLGTIDSQTYHRFNLIQHALTPTIATSLRWFQLDRINNWHSIQGGRIAQSWNTVKSS